MDCETCKEKRKVISQTPKDVPYIVHEGALARLERVIKRMWVLVLSLIILLFVSNAAWILYESQFSDIVTTIEAEQDGSGVNIVSGGDLEYGTEGENNNP